MNNITLKAGQVAAALDIDAKQLQNAVDAGHVRPVVAGTGRGSTRLYSFETVVQIKVLDILVRAYGLEPSRAAELVKSAWPRLFTKRKQTLVIVPILPGGAMKGGIKLEPIRLPLGHIAEVTEKRINQALATYSEKKRGRPAGWSKQMKETLTEVSEQLQETNDEEIRRQIESYRATKNLRQRSSAKTTRQASGKG